MCVDNIPVKKSSLWSEEREVSARKYIKNGVLIDLRGNSGGAMYEANRLTGLFIASGATVQVKESSGSIRPWGDGRAVQVWKKPLGVVVNRYSASASEIFAGAIQD